MIQIIREPYATRENAMPIDWQTMSIQHPLLGAIPSGLRDIARLQAFLKGERLFHQGSTPRAMLCVLDGEVRLMRRSPDGAEIILQRSHSGFIAEASLDAKTYHCDGIAASDGRLLLFPRQAFQTALEEDTAFNRAWIQQLAREVRRLRARSERLSLNSAAQRIVHYLEAEGIDGVITLKHSRKAWASELGLSHEVLYRTLRRLREQGIVTIDGTRITLRAIYHRFTARTDNGDN